MARHIYRLVHSVTLASYGIENILFIVSELVQVNPDNSRAINVSVNILLTVTQIEYTGNKNRQTLSPLKPWCNDSCVLNVHHGYCTTIMTSRRLFCHNPVSHGTNQPIKKSEFTVYEI